MYLLCFPNHTFHSLLYCWMSWCLKHIRMIAGICMWVQWQCKLWNRLVCLFFLTIHESPQEFCVEGRYKEKLTNHRNVKIGGWVLASKWTLAQSNTAGSEHNSGDIPLYMHVQVYQTEPTTFCQCMENNIYTCYYRNKSEVDNCGNLNYSSSSLPLHFLLPLLSVLLWHTSLSFLPAMHSCVCSTSLKVAFLKTLKKSYWDWYM